jgi:hypothetical protein
MTKTIAMLTRRRALLRRCAVGVFALVLAGLPTTWLAAPAVSRADGECAPGWAWSVELNQCVFVLPAANGPGGPGGPGDRADPADPGDRVDLAAPVDPARRVGTRHFI